MHMKHVPAKLLRIFISENDKMDGKPLFEWIVQKAREKKMAGATVLRGMEGFGAHSHLHTNKVLRLASDLPIVIEIVDTETAIDTFITLIDPVLSEGLVTVENVNARFHKENNR
ncbi:DUF190 domain-containing protein [bacterium]|nr:DUF190 domain-containing protein [bacterium]